MKSNHIASPLEPATAARMRRLSQLAYSIISNPNTEQNVSGLCYKAWVDLGGERQWRIISQLCVCTQRCQSKTTIGDLKAKLNPSQGCKFSTVTQYFPL